MRALFLALAATAIIGATEAPQVPKVVAVFGIKKPGSTASASCADLDTLDQAAVHFWLDGFFSGENVAGGRAVGFRSTGAALMTEVRNACRERPSAPLSYAIKATYDKVQPEQL